MELNWSWNALELLWKGWNFVKGVLRSGMSPLKPQGQCLKTHQCFFNKLLLECSHLCTDWKSLNTRQAQEPLSQGSTSPFKNPNFSEFC